MQDKTIRSQDHALPSDFAGSDTLVSGLFILQLHSPREEPLAAVPLSVIDYHLACDILLETDRRRPTGFTVRTAASAHPCGGRPANWRVRSGHPAVAR